MEGSILNKIIEIAVGLLLVATLIPVALVTMAGQQANMTSHGVSSVVITVLVVLLPILAIIGLALYFIPRWK